MISAIFIVLSLIILESLLSVDNAAVLAVMVNKSLSDEKDRKKALTWGIWGAYILRGVCLIFASVLVKFAFLKILGGLFLLRLCYTHFTAKEDSPEEIQDIRDKSFYKWVTTKLGLTPLWACIIMVEWVDLVFSMDNVFAAVALSDNIYLVMTGVFIGILAMRFVAQKFMILMEKYPSLGTSAFIVIGLLGVKLLLSGVLHYLPDSNFHAIVDSEWTDFVFSIGTLIVFLYPILKAKFLNADDSHGLY